MNLRQLETFVRVAELGSFSRAARVLGIAQPALSRQVRALETDLRETLLLRDGRGVRLTEAGKRLFDHGIGILQLVARAREDIDASRDEPTGRIVVGLPPSIARQLALPLIDTFRRELPHARLAIVEGLSTHIAEWIATGRVDLGLLHNPDAQPDLETTPIVEEPLALISPLGARRRPAPLPLRELPAYPLVVPERAHAIRRLLETQAARAGIKLDIAWEVSAVPAIIELVAAGHGHAVLPPSAVVQSEHGARLALRPIVEPRLATLLCLAVSATRRPTRLAQHLMQRLPALVREFTGPSATASRPMPH
ncbi:LysR substrate-binding domain-containing protein [Azohydromonas sp.]|uniref:LysR family transcriptional regulator n=1 Tax=Azohydromonas sp. TaxID=1872666 RepID=UPI002C67531D|nr:LysR substrate-binding domain-containing protein [Azohydromonas sp.]HMM85165.1 LysR substrate-binding domain-containing protein [Azohydromonas sp.]